MTWSAAAGADTYAGSGLGVYRGKKESDPEAFVPTLLTLAALLARGEVAILRNYPIQEVANSVEVDSTYACATSATGRKT